MSSCSKSNSFYCEWTACDEDMDDESDDDREFYRKPELPVADIKNLDLTRPPANGAEYLATVRLEAQKYPDVVTVDVKISDDSFSEPEEVEENPLEVFIKADSSICPSDEWQTEMVCLFRQIRSEVGTAVANIKRKNLKNVTPLPKASNISLWKETIVGKLDPESSVEKDSSLPLPEQDHPEGEEIKLLCQANSGLMPHLSVLALMSQCLIVNILEGLIDWIRQEGYSHRFGIWTYSLLACLEEPLHGEYVDILRKLSRLCSIIRSKHLQIEDKTLITSLNLLVCIIGKYFNQKDLSDS